MCLNFIGVGCQNNDKIEKFIANSFEIESNMIVVAVFLLIMNQPELCLIHNQKGNCHYDHIPIHLKGIINRFPWCKQDRITLV